MKSVLIFITCLFFGVENLEASLLDLRCSSRPDGNYADPDKCGSFYSCSNGNVFSFDCPGNLVFNPKTLRCDWLENVPSCQERTEKITSSTQKIETTIENKVEPSTTLRPSSEYVTKISTVGEITTEFTTNKDISTEGETSTSTLRPTTKYSTDDIVTMTTTDFVTKGESTTESEKSTSTLEPTATRDFFTEKEITITTESEKTTSTLKPTTEFITTKETTTEFVKTTTEDPMKSELCSENLIYFYFTVKGIETFASNFFKGMKLDCFENKNCQLLLDQLKICYQNENFVNNYTAIGTSDIKFEETVKKVINSSYIPKNIAFEKDLFKNINGNLTHLYYLENNENITKLIQKPLNEMTVSIKLSLANIVNKVRDEIFNKLTQIFTYLGQETVLRVNNIKDYDEKISKIKGLRNTLSSHLSQIFIGLPDFQIYEKMILAAESFERGQNISSLIAGVKVTTLLLKEFSSLTGAKIIRTASELNLYKNLYTNFDTSLSKEQSWFEIILRVYKELSKVEFQTDSTAKSQAIASFNKFKPVTEINFSSFYNEIRTVVPFLNSYSSSTVLTYSRNHGLQSMKLTSFNKLLTSVLGDTLTCVDISSSYTKCSGNFIFMSQVHAHPRVLAQKTSLIVSAYNSIIFNQRTVSDQSINISLIAPTIYTLNSPTYVLDGKSGVDRTGTGGMGGAAGNSGSNLNIIASDFVTKGNKLVISTNGGNGGRGQNGANGQPGAKGTSKYVSSSQSYCGAWSGGQSGGNGGHSGRGGLGGYQGTVLYKIANSTSSPFTLSRKNGAEGSCGTAGVGGSGGENGDTWRAWVDDVFSLSNRQKNCRFRSVSYLRTNTYQPRGNNGQSCIGTRENPRTNNPNYGLFSEHKRSYMSDANGFALNEFISISLNPFVKYLQSF